MCKIIGQEMTFRYSPHDILWEVFRRMPLFDLGQTASLCPEFAEVTRDKGLWQNLRFEYSDEVSPVAFEELFTAPYPIERISSKNCQIDPPKSTEIQKTEVTELDLDLGTLKAKTHTIKALVTKYPCKELVLDFDSNFRRTALVVGIASKYEGFEKLTLRNVRWDDTSLALRRQYWWLGHILETYCSNLKALHLSEAILSRCELLSLLKNAPRSLEKLGLCSSGLVNSDFELLAKRCPDLKELELDGRLVTLSSLLKFNFLESLRLDPVFCEDLTSLRCPLIKLRKLKSSHILCFKNKQAPIQKKKEKLRLLMEPNNVEVDLEHVPVAYSEYKKHGWFRLRHRKLHIRKKNNQWNSPYSSSESGL